MKKEEIFKKSLMLLDEVLGKLPKEKLSEMFGKYETMGYNGPTFDEYLTSFQKGGPQ